jgi:hypothetical protein
LAFKSPTALPELAADKATGEIKAIYQAIEAALGVRLVNLVYRHMATVPGALEWAWGVVGASFQSGQFGERSKQLLSLGISEIADEAPNTNLSLSSMGLSAGEADQVLATLDAYNRANPINALSLRIVSLALESGRSSSLVLPSVPDDEKLSQLPALLPIPPLDSLDSETLALLRRLACVTNGRETKIIPSIFRHFAPWPSLLTRLATWMEQSLDSDVIDGLADKVSNAADDIACDIYEGLRKPTENAVVPDAATRATLLETIEIFPPAICRMIVIGGVLRGTLRV